MRSLAVQTGCEPEPVAKGKATYATRLRTYKGPAAERGVAGPLGGIDE